MPVFRIHRLREHAFQHFRWVPHAPGSTAVKPRDYEPAGEIESETAYAAWFARKETGQPLRVGDLLESDSGSLFICKYVGFEEAHWVLPEPKPAAEAGSSNTQIAGQGAVSPAGSGPEGTGG